MVRVKPSMARSCGKTALAAPSVPVPACVVAVVAAGKSVVDSAAMKARSRGRAKVMHAPRRFIRQQSWRCSSPPELPGACNPERIGGDLDCSCRAPCIKALWMNSSVPVRDRVGRAKAVRSATSAIMVLKPRDPKGRGDNKHEGNVVRFSAPGRRLGERRKVQSRCAERSRRLHQYSAWLSAPGTYNVKIRFGKGADLGRWQCSE